MRFVLVFFVLSGIAVAQDLLVTRFDPARIEKYSRIDGTLIDGNFVDVDNLIGAMGANQFLWDVGILSNGEVVVSNYTAQAIHRFSSDGSTYLGDLGTMVGQSLGMGIDGMTLAVASLGGMATGGSGVYLFDLASQSQSQPIAVSGYWDATPFQGQILLSNSNGTLSLFDPISGTETPWATGTGFYEQTFVRADGSVFVADYNAGGYDEFDVTGAFVQAVTPPAVGSIRGVHELGNGNVMLSGSNGIFVHDPLGGTTSQINGGASAFIYGGSSGLISNLFCMPNPNSTGLPGAISGFGTTVIAANEVTLVAEQLPWHATTFFLTSQTQGMVANPGGSAGNLCVLGAIGRFVGPGQILNSGATGRVELRIDLTQVPQPQGFVSVMPGETWGYQAWHRDVAGAGVATSNFTDGLAVTYQ